MMFLRIGAMMLCASALPAVAMLAPPAQCQAATPAAAVTRMAHISIEAVGSGPPVILLPGLSSPRAVWDGVTPALAKTHRVYRVQVNGFGGDDPGENLDAGLLDGVVADLHAFIAKEGIVGAPMVGHSMGGLVGMMLARAHPGDIGRLMIVDSLPFIGVLFAPGATVAMIEPQAAAMREQMAAAPANDAMAQGIAASNALKPESRTAVAGWMKASDPRVSARAMYEDLTTDLRGELSGIAVPMTVVYPWSSGLPLARAKTLYEGEYAAAPNVAFVPVSDSGHFVMLDQPRAFAAALDAFLAN